VPGEPGRECLDTLQGVAGEGDAQLAAAVLCNECCHCIRGAQELAHQELLCGACEAGQVLHQDPQGCDLC
jgi:hypothetical protein